MMLGPDVIFIPPSPPSMDRTPQRRNAHYGKVLATGVANYGVSRDTLMSGRNTNLWERLLAPDHQPIVDYLRHGFPLAQDGPVPANTTQRNHQSADVYTDHVDKYILNELRAGTLLGPFTVSPFPKYSLSPLLTGQNRGLRDVGSLSICLFPRGGLSTTLPPNILI